MSVQWSCPWLLMLFLLGVTLCKEEEDETLYFTSPGEVDRYGTPTRRPGLYGGRLGQYSRDLSQNLFETGYHCMEYGSDREDQYDELRIESLSFDAKSGDVLLKVKMSDAMHLTVLRGPLCAGHHVCRNNTLKPMFYNVQLTDSRIQPLAISDDQIYFILKKDDQISRKSTRRTIELRKMEDRCKKDFPLDSTSMFNVDECTSQMTVLAEEDFESVPPVIPGSTLLVIQTATGPHFFVQLVFTRREGNSYISNIVLKQVDNNGKAREIHSEDVSNDYMQYEIEHVGGISMRDNLLCWSAYDCIYCGDWNGRELTNIRITLEKGRAKEICQSSRGEAALAHIITGVAIADSSNGDLYFGCIAQIPSSGGTVFLRHDEHGGVSLSAVSSNHTGYERSVYAGSMLLTDACTNGYGPSYRAVSSSALSVILPFHHLFTGILISVIITQLVTKQSCDL